MFSASVMTESVAVKLTVNGCMVNIVARSGIGIYRNFGGDRKGTDHTMPSEYDNTMLYRPEAVASIEPP